MALICKKCGNPGTKCICTSGDAAPEAGEKEGISEKLKQIEKFHDCFIDVQNEIDRLQGISTAFYTVGNLPMTQKLDKICDILKDNIVKMRDSFTYMITK